MKSKDLQEMYEGTCFLFTKENMCKIPKQSGVYTIFHEKILTHIIGESDIVYIGKSDEDLQKRLKEYFNPGPSQETNKKINRFLRIKGKKWILVIPVVNKAEARDFENELLKKFRNDHLTLPPLNK